MGKGKSSISKKRSKKRFNYFLLLAVSVAICFILILKASQTKGLQYNGDIIKTNITEYANQTEVLPFKSETESNKEIKEEEVVMSSIDYEVLKATSIVDTSCLTADEIDSLFYSCSVSGEVLSRIQGISYKENNTITPEDLRYLRVLHMGFDGQTHIGELIVNEIIANDILCIMRELFENEYPIEKMVLIDDYNGDDNLSMADNNSSAFNYRTIAGSTKLSKHSLGLAVDINPVYNPYVRKNQAMETMVEPANGESFVDRYADFPYKIGPGDLSYDLFKSYGFTWGGDWNSVKDYQHFEKSL